MVDMLVKLYQLPDLAINLNHLLKHNIVIRRALAPELHLVTEWVSERFSLYWKSETFKAFANKPISCYIALDNDKLVGFACIETTANGFFGPTGVVEEARGRGIGKSLLVYALHQLQNLGYAYAIIGGVGPKEFYAKHVGAIEIPGSNPGVYEGLLRP